MFSAVPTSRMVQTRKTGSTTTFQARSIWWTSGDAKPLKMRDERRVRELALKLHRPFFPSRSDAVSLHLNGSAPRQISAAVALKPVASSIERCRSAGVETPWKSFRGV